MRVKWKRIATVILAVYLLLSGYAAYKLFNNLSASDKPAETWTRGIKKPQIQEELPGSRLTDWDFSLDDSLHQDPPDAEPDVKHEVEVWGKAAIGIYLWEHILDGDVIQKMAGVWSFGIKQIKEIKFFFRTGPGVVPNKVPQNVKNLILVLNGREQSKIGVAKVWLEHLASLPSLRNAAVVLLGDEGCDNDWIKSYMSVNGGLVQFVFVVYDSADVDNVNFYQWPLGVATYRNFPHVDISSINSQKKRYFQCNFLGTIYQNSSRQQLLELLQEPGIGDRCYVKPRLQWWAMETQESQADYIHALLQSDYTLSPVGLNPECYRIYESMAYGSIPILENRTTTGRCRQPYSLLRKYRAPVIYLQHWTELKRLLSEKISQPLEKTVRHRQNILEWYIFFRRKMKERFIGIVRKRFFDLS